MGALHRVETGLGLRGEPVRRHALRHRLPAAQAAHSQASGGRSLQLALWVLRAPRGAGARLIQPHDSTLSGTRLREKLWNWVSVRSEDSLSGLGLVCLSGTLGLLVPPVPGLAGTTRVCSCPKSDPTGLHLAGPFPTIRSRQG